MNSTQHDALVGFIWRIADDGIRDVHVRGKYRDIILSMTVSAAWPPSRWSRSWGKGDA
jgi:hypothetical protein